jgi:hypothetical protein
VSGTLYNPAVEQTVRVWSSHSADTEEINNLLKDGWQIVSVTGAGAGGGGEDSYSHEHSFFVVLERRRS